MPGGGWGVKLLADLGRKAEGCGPDPPSQGRSGVQRYSRTSAEELRTEGWQTPTASARLPSAGHGHPSGKTSQTSHTSHTLQPGHEWVRWVQLRQLSALHL